MNKVSLKDHHSPEYVVHDSFQSQQFIITSNVFITAISSMNYDPGCLVFRFHLYRIPYSISARLLLNESRLYCIATSSLTKSPLGAQRVTELCQLLRLTI